MKTYFRSLRCTTCGGKHDPKEKACPRCGEKIIDPDLKRFAHHLPFPFWKELIFFFLAFLGLSIFATIIQLIEVFAAMAAQGFSYREAVDAVSRSADMVAFVQFGAYGILAIIVGLLIWRTWKYVFRSFLGWKPYVFAIIGFTAIIVFEIGYGYFLNLICYLLGVESGSNANQNALVSIIHSYPALSLTVFGIVGPFIEEMAYRVGLFGFFSRLGKVFGYLITIFIFGLIHFDPITAFSFASNRNAAILEWLNLPSYLVSGAVFAFLYDKFGFACSFSAHAVNNLFSIILNMIPGVNP